MDSRLTEIYENVIGESIKHVVCIDDDFIDAYDDSCDIEKRIFSQRMYRAISDACDCHVEMLPYSDEVGEDKLNKYISNKDLMILDWELLGGGERIPLSIIEKAIAQEIPFICIYTNENDLETIYASIMRYFFGLNKVEVESICDRWEEAGMLEGDFKDDVQELFAKYHDKGIDNESWREFCRKVQVYCDSNDIDFGKMEIQYRDPGNWYPLYLKWNNITLPETRLSRALRNENGIIVIDGKIIVCFSKDSAINPQSTTVEDIIPSIAKNVILTPHNKFNIIWLKYCNSMRNAIQERSNLLHSIDEDALGFFANKLLDESTDEFNRFFRGIYKDEVMGKMDCSDVAFAPQIIDDIKDTYKDLVVDEGLSKGLVQLNEKISVNSTYTRMKHKIDLGDIFVDQDQIWWLCVTAKCDCCRPSKIDNCYFFVRGQKCDNDIALRDAEKGYYSFVQHEKKYIAIEWYTTKIRSICFEDNENIVDGVDCEKKGVYKRTERVYKYVCNLKENYAQRMANSAFAERNRVGISFANTRDDVVSI